MYFNVYGDSGVEIHGYLVPDGFSSEPEIVVRVGGEIAAQIMCDDYIDGPRQQQLHETGIVGFKLSDQNVPGLSASYDIEISDAATGFVIYRRLEPGRFIEKRVFRLETHLEPWIALDRFLAPHFQFHVSSVDSLGSETVRQSLEVINQPSTYVSGRILFKRFQIYLAKETVAIAALEDPFVELAARISILREYSDKPLGFLTDRDRLYLRPAIDYLAELDLQNERSVRARMKAAPKDVLALFTSPFTHQLSAASPSDIMRRDSLSVALDTLSQFTLLGIDGETDSMASDVAELLGLPDHTMPPKDTRARFDGLAGQLRSIGFLEQVLESDLILYHFVRNARKRALIAPWGSD